MARIPTPEAKMPEKKLPVNGYGRSSAVFRPAPSPAGALATLCVTPSRWQRLARHLAAVALATTPFTGPFLATPTLAASPAAGAAAGAGVHADLVLRRGQIYTMDAARSWAESMAVSGGRIVFVGADRDVASFISAQTRVVDLGGRFVLPGFHDRHTHPISGGVELTQCDLNSSADRDEVLARLRACVARLGDRPWLVGGGWDLTLFPGGVADRRDLDAILPDRPALLASADGHSSWVNSKALELAGVTAATSDPEGGRIERDATGAPIGTLRESAAELVDHLLPETTAAERLAGLRLAVAKAHGFGIVAMTEANADPEMIATFDSLDRAGELGLRIVVSQGLDSDEGPAGIPALVAVRAAPHAPHVRATAVKLFADGVIEGGTAALLEPYIGGRSGLGIPNWSAKALEEAIVALDRERFQIHIHAIGDRAIRDALDGLAAARAANGVRDARPMLAHIQLFAPSDIPRFRELGVIANFQPLWAYADDYIRDLTAPFLGPERMRWNYPIASLAKSGAALAAGSDWSVSSMNPLEAIEVAITRCDPELTACDRPWIPEERVDLATMLAAYTIGGAYAGFEERDSGSLETGKLADLVVLDRNLFAIPPGGISDAKVLLTLFEGREVFGSLDEVKARASSKGGL
jgi:predicted amidohydrolase YtcJ